MVVLQFREDEIRRACCDLANMRRQWGSVVARRISRRLQQLEAMTSLADLSFLPCESVQHSNGVFEVAVTDDLALFMERGTDARGGESLMHTIMITDLRNTSTSRTS